MKRKRAEFIFALIATRIAEKLLDWQDSERALAQANYIHLLPALALIPSFFRLFSSLRVLQIRVVVLFCPAGRKVTLSFVDIHAFSLFLFLPLYTLISIFQTLHHVQSSNFCLHYFS